jgi:hypothetical protein
VSKVQKPTMNLKASSAHRQLKAARCRARSVTWPALRRSFTTRVSEAGEVAADMEAIRAALIGAAPKVRHKAYTATKVSATSSTPVAVSHGLMRNQRRLMR